MIDAEFVESIKGLAQEAAKTEIIEVASRKYTVRDLKPVKDPMPEALRVTSLAGIVDYVKSNFDQKHVGRFQGDEPQQTNSFPFLGAIHVIGPREVHLLGPISGDFLQRPVYLKAVWDQDIFPFDQWLDQEKFILSVQSMIMPTDARDQLLSLAGNVTDIMKAEFADDGVSQTVTVQTGVVKKENVTLPNPVTLKPYRVFTEVDQPEGPFVFRMRREPSVGFRLIEADAGTWKIAAKKAIKTYFQQELPGVPVIL